MGGMSTLERLRAGAWERGGSTAGGERDRPSPPIGSLRKKKPGCDPRHYLAPPSRHNNDTPQLSAVRWGCWFGQQRARRRCLTAPPRFALFFLCLGPAFPPHRTPARPATHAGAVASGRATARRGWMASAAGLTARSGGCCFCSEGALIAPCVRGHRLPVSTLTHTTPLTFQQSNRAGRRSGAPAARAAVAVSGAARRLPRARVWRRRRRAGAEVWERRGVGEAFLFCFRLGFHWFDPSFSPLLTTPPALTHRRQPHLHPPGPPWPPPWPPPPTMLTWRPTAKRWPRPPRPRGSSWLGRLARPRRRRRATSTAPTWTWSSATAVML